MGNTWIVDIRHYLDPSGAFADMPSRARLLAEYFTSIVVDATTNIDNEPTDLFTYMSNSTATYCNSAFIGARNWGHPGFGDVGCPHLCPHPGMAAPGRQWASMDMDEEFL